ncbi:MAG: glycosyltransferase family 4 protein [Vulcanimicrobiota bacterium]
MKIAIFYDLIYPHTLGGAEKRFRELAIRLARRGHQVHYYCGKFWVGPTTYLDQGVVTTGLTLPDSSTRAGLRTYAFVLRYAFHLLRVLRKENFDVVEFCNFPYLAPFLGATYLSLRRRPYCVTWLEYTGNYWNQVGGPAAVVGRLLEAGLLRLSRSTLSISRFTLNRLTKIGHSPTRSRVIEAGFSERRETATKGEGGMIYVGRLQPHKRVDLLLRAQSVLHQKGVKIVLTIVGKGPERSCLEALANELGLMGKVTFLHSLADEVLTETLARSSVLVLPSEREGLGMVVIEAMALGVPSVTVESEFNAAKEIVSRGGVGIVAQPDPNSLAAAIAEVLQNREEFSRNCLSASRQYEWVELSKQLEEFLKDVAGYR